MTIKDCIDIVDNAKPNQYTTKEKVMWLSFVDETIINDVLKTHEGYDDRYDLFEGYSEDKLSVALIVQSPYDRLYTQYLKMKIDLENGEMARYNNSSALYNAYLLEFKKYYNKTHMPLKVGRNKATSYPEGNNGIGNADIAEKAAMSAEEARQSAVRSLEGAERSEAEAEKARQSAVSANASAVSAIDAEASVRKLAKELNSKDYSNGNESNIPLSYIEGKDNKAIVKCFMIKSFTENTITLDSVEGIKVGMMWNIFIEDATDEKGYRKLRGTVKAINGNTCTLENGSIPVTLVASGVVASALPEFFGTFIVCGGSIGTHTISDADNTSFYLHMSGENNIGYLNCRINGTGNKGLAFNAVIDGYFCEVYGERGTAIGYRCLIGDGAESAFAGGHTCKVYAVGGFAYGYMCEVTELGVWGQAFGDHTVSNAYGQFVAGRWNIVDVAGEYLFIIGNGDSLKGRSNALVVDKQGNVGVTGKVYAEGKELATKESVDNLNKSKGMVFKGIWKESTLPNTMLDDTTPDYSIVGATYKLKNETSLQGYAHRLTAGAIIKFPENDPNYLVTVVMRSDYLNEDLAEFTRLFKILGIVDMDFQLVDQDINIPCERFVGFHITTAEATYATFTGEDYTANITSVKYDAKTKTIGFKGSWIKSPSSYKQYNHPRVAYATDNIYNAYNPYVGYYKPIAKVLGTFPKDKMVTYSLNCGWVDF